MPTLLSAATCSVFRLQHLLFRSVCGICVCKESVTPGCADFSPNSVVSCLTIRYNVKKCFRIVWTGGMWNFIYFFKFYFIFKLYIIVLVLPNIKLNPPQVYMSSPPWMWNFNFANGELGASSSVPRNHIDSTLWKDFVYWTLSCIF